MASSFPIQIGNKRLLLNIDQLPPVGKIIKIGNCIEGISGLLEITFQRHSLIGLEPGGKPIFGVVLYAQKAS